MALDIFTIDNPGMIAVAIGALCFVIAFSLLNKRFERGVALVVSLALGVSAGWYLYREWLDLGINLIVILMSLVALGIIFIIFRAFFRFGKKQFS